MSETLRVGNKVMVLTPSETWTADIVSDLLAGFIELKSQVGKELNRTKLWPPGGADVTPMVHCRKCGAAKWIPHQYVNNDNLCADCFEAARAPTDPDLRKRRTTHSSSAEAIHAAEDAGAVIIELPLASEDEQVLREEITRYIGDDRHRRVVFSAREVK